MLTASEKLPLLPKLPRRSRSSPWPVLVIHGGAGTFSKERASPEQRELYKSALKQALFAGNEVLKYGGNAMDAALAAVSWMEDCPLFNCAKGAVFNVAGKIELEASIMLSKPPATHLDIPKTRRGFSLALLTRTRNPSKLARALYLSPDLAPHAFLSGEYAEQDLNDRLKDRGMEVELVDPSYFWTEGRWREHRRGLGLPEEDIEPPKGCALLSARSCHRQRFVNLDMLPQGTVGAVALDRDGCIAAVTSTGGKTNKLVGRIGDTPSMGSGFWAEEWIVPRKGFKAAVRRFFGMKQKMKHRAVGVSGTGDGDYFIRQATSTTLCSRMRLLDESVTDAAKNVVEDLRKDGGIGGVIALDEKGTPTFALNSNGMYRGYIKVNENHAYTAIFDDDLLE